MPDHIMYYCVRVRLCASLYALRDINSDLKKKKKRLYKHNWNRPFQKSLRCRDQTRKFSRSYPRPAPRKREGIQGLSRGKSEINQLSQADGDCYSGVLGHSRRGDQRKLHIQSGNSFNMTSSGSLPTSKGIVCWNRCPPLCSSLYYALLSVPL